MAQQAEIKRSRAIEANVCKQDDQFPRRIHPRCWVLIVATGLREARQARFVATDGVTTLYIGVPTSCCEFWPWICSLAEHGSVVVP